MLNYLIIMKNSPVVGIAVSEAFSERIAGYLQLSYLWKFIIVNVEFAHNIIINRKIYIAYIRLESLY